ncbi:MAG TPA: energy transducer TonB [Gemmatimonadaceae bacterium]|nr:energy transducer TonB [Gemmatimonadaceae bacterium]
MRLVTLISSLAGLVLAGAVPSTASAQTIAGIVIDAASRLPLRQVDVHVLGDSGRTVADARTDTLGIFYAMVLTGGVYRVRFVLDSTTWFDSDTVRVASDGYVERQFVVRLPRVYAELEVEKQVRVRSGSALPRYPAALRSLNIEGSVLAQFVVDTTGRAQMSTFKVLRASHGDFILAVREAVSRMSFYPAEIGHHKVRQMVQQPFDFRLSASPSPFTVDQPPETSTP